MTGSFGDTDKNTETLTAEWEAARKHIVHQHVTTADEWALQEKGDALAAALATAQERERTLRAKVFAAGNALAVVRDVVVYTEHLDKNKAAKCIDAVDSILHHARRVASSGGQTQPDLGVAQSAPSVATEDGKA